MPKYNLNHMRKGHLLRWFFYLFTGVVLALVFSSYFAPEVMIAVANQVWAFCGW
jgi:hypothetical protein